ncbi:MAG: hypothetical protein V1674_03075 [Candidatus Omnitrophota bacterium]
MTTRDRIAVALIVLLTISIPIILTSVHPDRERVSIFKKRIEVLRKNLEDEFFPQVRKPLSTYPAEEKLVSYFPDPFSNFSKADWDKFWSFIYRLHDTDDYGKDFSPKRKRQLTRSELEEALSREYPMPFGYFKREHWEEFWRDIIKYGK